MDERQVVKANALVEASYRLDVGEQRILLACISQIKKGESISDQVLYTVKASEIAEMAGVTRQTAYADLKKAAAQLYERSISLPGEDGHRFRWIQEEAHYSSGEGYVSIRFSTAVIPYISELKNRFTVYHLRDVAKLTSSHAIRLYEILMQRDDLGSREVSIEWLRKAFCIENKYPVMSDLKKNVIEPAVKQINKHTPMKVSWSQRKTGRRVSHLRFTFSTKEQVTPAKPAKKLSGIPKALLDKFRQPGDTDEQAAERVRAARAAAEG